jgi:hypothetical protein
MVCAMVCLDIRRKGDVVMIVMRPEILESGKTVDLYVRLQ